MCLGSGWWGRGWGGLILLKAGQWRWVVDVRSLCQWDGAAAVMMPRSRRQPTGENPFRTLPPKCVFKARSLHVIEEGKKKKKTLISHCGTEWLTKAFSFFFSLLGWVMHSHQLSHILSYGVARTVGFVIRCGSYIHTWRVLPRHRLVFTALYDISRQALPGKRFHFVFFPLLPFACTHVRGRKSKKCSRGGGDTGGEE